ncbi:5-formyltetrahydrofolate cyclo-ligase [Luteolibacter algae]|uniref:5-formyltetrahydrofolate cyclo-ligase n=1 Tax=Luteolibacter algae TaxID=454151 RepID=A0ABW5D5J6_9BACT
MTNPDDRLAEYLAGDLTRKHRKVLLRQELRRKIDDHGPGDSDNVVAEIIAYLRERTYLHVVAIFAALPGEVDLRSLPKAIGRVFVFPKVVENHLVFFRVNSFEEDLELGAYGILEPKDGLEVVAVEKIDLFLCPGLGFDLKGGRVGRGKGYYDRVLEKARAGAVKIGVCFGYQLVDEITMEEHDIRMNGVIAG